MQPNEVPPEIQAIIDSTTEAIRRNAAILAALDNATVSLHFAGGKVKSVYLEKMRLDDPASPPAARAAGPRRRVYSPN